MRKIILAASMLSILVVTQSSAGDFYVGTSLGKSDFSLSGSDKLAVANDGYSITDDSASVYKVYTGYRFNPNFALELSYVDLGKVETKNGTKNIDIEADSIGISLLGIVPLNENIEVFGKLGLHRWDVKVKGSNGNFSATDSDSGTDVNYGVGASYILDQVALRIEVEKFTVDSADSTLITAGISYHF